MNGRTQVAERRQPRPAEARPASARPGEARATGARTTGARLAGAPAGAGPAGVRTAGPRPGLSGARAAGGRVAAPRPATAPPAPRRGAPRPGGHPAASPGTARSLPGRRTAPESRTRFVFLIVGLLGGGLLSLLMINTVLAAGAFRITALQQGNVPLAQRVQALQAQVAAEESPTRWRSAPPPWAWWYSRGCTSSTSAPDGCGASPATCLGSPRFPGTRRDPTRRWQGWPGPAPRPGTPAGGLRPAPPRGRPGPRRRPGSRPAGRRGQRWR